MHELRLELHSTDRTVKVDAVKKVIASMTVGKDVSMLFTDVLNCVQTGNIGESSSCKPAPPPESLMRASEGRSYMQCGLYLVCGIYLMAQSFHSITHTFIIIISTQNSRN
jgi:hypothetical protein